MWSPNFDSTQVFIINIICFYNSTVLVIVYCTIIVPSSIISIGTLIFNWLRPFMRKASCSITGIAILIQRFYFYTNICWKLDRSCYFLRAGDCFFLSFRNAKQKNVFLSGTDIVGCDSVFCYLRIRVPIYASISTIRTYFPTIINLCLINKFNFSILNTIRGSDNNFLRLNRGVEAFCWYCWNRKNH